MKKNNLNSKTEKDNVFKAYFEYIGLYIKKNYRFLILLLTGFITLSLINLAKISTSETVASFSLKEFEIGQIADRTIIADKTIPADEANPFAIVEGEKIIKKGFAITEDGYHKLEKMVASPVYIDYRAYANTELFLFFVCVLWYLLFSFLPFYRKIQFRETLTQVICFLLVFSVAAFGGKISFFSNPFSICIILPASLCAMLITILFGHLSAVIFSCVLSLGVLCASNWELFPTLYTMAATLSACVMVRKINKRIHLVAASAFLAIFYVVIALVLIVIFNETLSDKIMLFVGVLANGFLSGILTLGLLTPLEYMLNTASVFRLMDLSDISNPLLQKMLVNASGTYNHSMMVAQLSENACREIGANSLLAKVGAYYHDIGKIDQSEYFTENQLDGINKHDDINPTLSTTIIRSHVRKGVEKAHQMHLPQAVIDIISEHHGNSVISYFYSEALKKDPTLNAEDFTYNGNPPSTRESAVVMMADTVEAACRTLENPSVSRLEKFINTLVTSKIEHNQLDNCDLTFKDITKIKEAFLQILAGYYHSRVKYPDQKDPDSEAKNEAKTEAKAEVKAESKSESKKEDSKKEETKESKKEDSKKDDSKDSKEEKNE